MTIKNRKDLIEGQYYFVEYDDSARRFAVWNGSAFEMCPPSGWNDHYNQNIWIFDGGHLMKASPAIVVHPDSEIGNLVAEIEESYFTRLQAYLRGMGADGALNALSLVTLFHKEDKG